MRFLELIGGLWKSLTIDAYCLYLSKSWAFSFSASILCCLALRSSSSMLCIA